MTSYSFVKEHLLDARPVAASLFPLPRQSKPT
jgi:hypothetical protein